MEKWKSRGRISTFPRLITLSKKSKTKGDQSRPDTLGFRLISGLENAITTKALSQNKSEHSGRARKYGVVPLSMESIALQPDCCDLCVGDPESFGVFSRIELRADSQSPLVVVAAIESG
jgi:hypothetical protein